MKRIASLFLAAAMALSLAACSGSGSSSSSAAASAPASEPASASASGSTAAAEGEGLDIVLVSTAAGVDDGSFIQNTWEGVQAFVESRGGIDTTNNVEDPSGDPAQALQAVADVMADYDVIVTPGFQFAAIGTLAAENPDKYFILIDSAATDENGETVDLPNVAGLMFAEQEGGFFAGLAAAMTTQTGKVASVHGIAYESNVNYQYGFESGVNYANAHYGTTAEVVEIPAYAGTDIQGTDVGGNYVGSFGDVATAKTIADALIGEGVDVLFAAAGDSGNGVLTSVKEHAADGVWFIGCDADQYDDGENGDSNVVLTSSLKCMDVAVARELNKIVDGTFEGGTQLLKADTDSTGFVSEEGRQQLSEEALAAMEECLALVKDGTIVPAANFNGYTPDDFPGLA